MPYSLTISWTAASPAPSNGYRVKYWPTSNPSNITTVTPNVSGTTYTITGLTGTSYSGTVESACGGGNFSTAQNFSATYTPTYYYYALNEHACSTCTLGSTAKAGRSTSILSTSSGTHYKVGSNTYVVTTEITPAPASFDIDLDTATQTGATCAAACAVTNYYYTGLLCGGSIVETFTSTQSNLADGNYIVKAFCSTCGGTVQCFDNISPTTTPTTNPVIDTFGDCSTCNSSL